MKKILSMIPLFVVGLAFNVFANPEGATVVSGSATFDTSTQNILTVKTASDKTIINYDSFSIAANESAIFNQPNASSVVLNRVIGIDPSLIYGNLSSNGKLFLVNPNGILFGPGSQVNAPAIVASTLDINDQDFLNGNYTFKNNKGHSYITNQGNLAAQPGGYIALLSQSSNNEGIILADSGTIALAAGDKMTLGLDSQNQISVVVDDAVQSQVTGPDGWPIKNAVSNSGIIQANGGKVVLTAKVMNNIFDYAINNSGIVEANAIQNNGGKVQLFSSGAPTLNTGTIKANQVDLTSDSDIYSLGDLESSFLTEHGRTFQVGGLFNPGIAYIQNADDAIVYSANTQISGSITDAANIILNPFITLTLNGNTSFLAGGAFIMDTTSTISGAGYDLSLTAGSDSTLGNINNVNLLTLNSGSGADITFISDSSSAFQANTVKTNNHSILSRSVGSGISSDPIMIYSVSNAPGGLEYIQTSGNLGSDYQLANNIDASETSSWNGGQGFLPIGTPDSGFFGSFDGNTKTISNLYINRPQTDYIGLFGNISVFGTNISELGLVNSNITGRDFTGGLIGSTGYFSGSSDNVNLTDINNVYVTGKISGNEHVGGLVGYKRYSELNNSYNAATVSGNSSVGGLVGFNKGHLTYSYNKGRVIGGNEVGGLVGQNDVGSIGHSYNTGIVSGGNYVGGLAGKSIDYYQFGSIYDSYNSGAVSGSDAVGGLVGFGGFFNLISLSHNEGNVSGHNQVGGVIGSNGGNSRVVNSYNTGKVVGAGNYIGGVAGGNFQGTIGSSYNTGTVSGMDYVGGISGLNDGHNYGGLIGGTYNQGAVTGQNYVGGVVGLNQDVASLGASYNLAVVVGRGNFVGGVAGANGLHSRISGSYNLGNVSGKTRVGGLVGSGNAYGSSITNSFYDADTVLINKSHAITLGALYDNQFSDWLGHGTLDPANYFSQDASGRYLINTLADLKNILGFTNTRAYKFLLTNDINLGSASGFYVPMFLGGFDGNGKSISNLKVNLSNDNIGMFGVNLGSIKNIGLVNVKVTGLNSVGGIVGANGGEVTNAYVTGTVQGADMVGGLAGRNSYHTDYGSISNAYNTAKILGVSNVGGLVGWNSGFIANAFNTGKVSGQNNVGGLVGSTYGGITNSAWWTGASENAIGYNYATGGAVARLSLQGFGTDEAVKSSFFSTSEPGYSSWDFLNLWKMPKHNYPLFR
jgi:filamentous hemagglutinin family protein